MIKVCWQCQRPETAMEVSGSTDFLCGDACADTYAYEKGMAPGHRIHWAHHESKHTDATPECELCELENRRRLAEEAADITWRMGL